MSDINKQWSIAFRPSKLDDCIVGNHEIIGEAKRLALNAQAVLITGTSGTGKTTIARAMANELNNNDKSNIYVDASEQNIDKVREIGKLLRYSPQGKKWVVIMDEVHGFSGPALKALLTLIETPPTDKVLFLLCTDQLNSIPDQWKPQLKGRCRHIHIKKPTFNQAKRLLVSLVGKAKCGVTKEQAIALSKHCFMSADGTLRQTLQDLQSACDRLKNKVPFKQVLSQESYSSSPTEGSPKNVEQWAGSLLLALYLPSLGKKVEDSWKFILPLPMQVEALPVLVRAQEILYYGYQLKLGGKWTWQAKSFDAIFKGVKLDAMHVVFLLSMLTELIEKVRPSPNPIAIASGLCSIATSMKTG